MDLLTSARDRVLMTVSPTTDRGSLPLALRVGVVFSLVVVAPLTAGELHVHPPKLVLRGPESSHQLRVELDTEDVTVRSEYQVEDASVVRVDDRGRLYPLAEGTTEVVVSTGKQVARVEVDVIDLDNPEPVSFRHQVLPILTKAGCNSGGCHGKAEGQNGFKLSVFGFDPEADHEALTRESRGRRVLVGAPDRSVLLLKSTARLPHGGGHRIPQDGVWYQRIRRWVAEGAQLDESSAVSIQSIEVEPADVQLGMEATLQLQVTATRSDGIRYCVTGEAEFESNAVPIADVDRDGLIQAFGCSR